MLGNRALHAHVLREGLQPRQVQALDVGLVRGAQGLVARGRPKLKNKVSEVDELFANA